MAYAGMQNLSAEGSQLATYQFIRIQGFPRGNNRTKKGSTLNSVLSEGRRVPSFSRHVSQPDIQITPIDRSFGSVVEYQAWIEQKMSQSRIPLVMSGKTHYRSLRTDAVAIGTIIVSLPSPTKDTPNDLRSIFKEECLNWCKGYLNRKGLSLDYCVEHYDEEYPHLHFWFTPGDDQIARKVWYLGEYANPKLKEKNLLRHNFFEEVGHKYVDHLQKEKDQRIKRQPSRYMASLNRLPAGQPEALQEAQPTDLGENSLGKSTDSLFGIPLASGSQTKDVSHSSKKSDIEQSPHFIQAISQLLSAMLDNRRKSGLLSEEELLSTLLADSVMSLQTTEKLKQAILSRRQSDEGQQDSRTPRTDNLLGDREERNRQSQTVLSDLARGGKFTPPKF